MTNATQTHGITAEYTATMHRAFDLVCPRKRVEALVAAGKLKPEHIVGISWKDEIGSTVTDEELNAANVTIDEVADAIEFFTATTATVRREKIAGNGIVKFNPVRDGYLVTAPGYNRGPAR